VFDPGKDVVGVQVHLLGRVSVDLGDMRVEPSGALRKGALALLALAPGEVVSAARLIDALWGEQAPATAGNSLQSHVCALRRTLGSRDAVEWRSGGYLLRVTNGDVDASRAEALIAQALRTPDEATARDLLRQALALWRGPALADVRELPGLSRDADRLDALRLQAETALVDLRLRVGESADLVPGLEQLVASNPLDEGLHGRLMTALYRCGRQSDALRVFRDVRALLDRELGIDPGCELRDLETAILRQDPGLNPARTQPARSAPTASVRQPLPEPLSSFIGREQEMAAVLDSLRAARLVTLVGTGGVGKTRLAVEAARTVQPDFDVVAFADLSLIAPEDAPSNRTSAVVAAVLRALGAFRECDDEPDATLHAVLAARSVLVVIDNCEHLLGSVRAVLAEALPAAPSCQVLATSREPLAIPGEQAVPLEPLDLPDPAHAATAELMRASAMQLLAQRARTHDPWFTVSDESAPALAELCRYLDGLPLAVELAASRLRLMRADELLATLRTGPDVLVATTATAPARHRSLDDAVRWSYSLLTAPQQAAFRAFGAFRGGGTLDDIAQVSPAATVDMMALVDKSLLHRFAGPWPSGTQALRLDAHGAVARTAEALLAGAPDAADVRRRHARRMCAVLEQRGAPGCTTHDVRDLAVEHANVAAALEWAGDSTDPADLVLGLTIGARAWWLWFRTGHAQAGRRLLDRLLSRADPSGTEWPAAASAAGYLAWLQDDFAAALQLADRAFACPSASVAARAMALGVRSRALGDQGDFAGARCAALRSAKLYDGEGDAWGATWSRRCAATAALFLGDTVTAEAEAIACLDTYRTLADSWGQAGTLDQLASITHRRGDHRRALELAEQAVALHRALGDASGLRYSLQHHAEAAGASGDRALACRCAGESLSLARVHGYRVGVLQALVLLAELAVDGVGSRDAGGHAREALVLAGELGDDAAAARARAVLTSVGAD
jgi:predicted ATPase/DNA-binding SARP family transcriptional activator